MTLEELIAPPDKELMRQRLFTLLQGIGFTRRAGFSPGQVTLTGTPIAEFVTKIKVIAAGSIGTATIQYSVDDGVTYSATTTIPIAGTLSLGSTGLTMVFTDGPSGSGDSFRAADVFTIDVQRASFPVTSFQVGSTARTLIENDAAALAELWSLVYTLAQSSLILEADGEWTRLIAKQFYKLDYYPAVATQGYVKFTDTSGGGPYSIAENQVWVQTAGGKRFNTQAAFVIPASGTINVLVQAESPGALWNVGVGQINRVVTSLPGVTVSNPVYASGDWITRSGSDDESNAALIARCQARWPDLSNGATAQQYDIWAREADSSVTRTRIAASTTQEGFVDIVLASASGGVSLAAIIAVGNYLTAKKPLTEGVSVQSAFVVNIIITATLYVRAGFEAAAIAEAEDNLTRLFVDNGIGTTMYRNNIIEELSTPEGVRNVDLSLPAGDTVLTSTQVAVPITTLTVVTV